jgi:acyl-CoA reductase-like NAD-dependent aldehyde dehydrogenase
VPQAQVNAVSDALIARLQKVVVGDPAQEGVKMGALVNHEQRQDVQENVNRLMAAGCDVLLGRPISAPPAPSSRRRCCTARSRMKPRRYTPLKPLARSPP